VEESTVAIPPGGVRPVAGLDQILRIVPLAKLAAIPKCG